MNKMAHRIVNQLLAKEPVGECDEGRKGFFQKFKAKRFGAEKKGSSEAEEGSGSAEKEEA